MFLMYYLIKVGLKPDYILGVDVKNRSSDRFLEALSKPTAVHERLEETQNNTLQSVKWKSDKYRMDYGHYGDHRTCSDTSEGH